jgi:hypothetical protein
MEHVLYYLILGERKELSRHESWQAAWKAAAQRKHNYCGSSLYIEEASKFAPRLHEVRSEFGTLIFTDGLPVVEA